MRRLLTLFLLMCASTHCVLSIFFVNHSWIDLHRYAQGTERLPYQGRLLMIPVLRWAESSHAMQFAAAHFSNSPDQREPVTAAKFICILLGVLLINALGLWSIRYARAISPRHWWMLWAFILLILYVSYAARYEQALWYPYDLPHVAMFGAATLALLSDEPWLFLAFITVDIALRETAVFLLPVAAALRLRSPRWRVVLAVSALLWIASRLLARHLYAANEPFHYSPAVFLKILAPWHQPQLLSIVGFLWLPLLLAGKWLSAEHRRALHVASLMMLVTFYFATWNETRVWAEWTVLFATLAMSAFLAALREPEPPRPRETIVGGGPQLLR